MTMYLSGQAVRRSIVHPHTNRFVSTKSLPNILSSHSTTLGNEGLRHLRISPRPSIRREKREIRMTSFLTHQIRVRGARQVALDEVESVPSGLVLLLPVHL